MVESLYNSITKGKTYTIPADQINADAVHPMLTAAPFTVRAIDDESGTFQIVGTELKFAMTSLQNISVWGESNDPMKFEEGHRYEFVEDLIPYFYTRFNTESPLINSRNNMIAQSLVNYMGGTNTAFTVTKVSKSGDVVTIKGKEDVMPPKDLMYVLEADDRRYFRDITESAAEEDMPAEPVSVSLEDKLEALFSVPGTEYTIRSSNASTVRLYSAEQFMKWVEDQLTYALSNMETARENHEKLVAQVTQICNTLRKVV